VPQIRRCNAAELRLLGVFTDDMSYNFLPDAIAPNLPEFRHAADRFGTPQFTPEQNRENCAVPLATYSLLIWARDGVG
jgi:hypothetical protein